MPDYVSIPSNGDGVGKAVVSVELSVLLIAFISCVLRVSASRVKGLELRWDDYLIFMAMFFTAGLTAAHCVMAFQGGLGLLIQDSTPDSGELSLKMFAPVEVLWSFANTLVKLSFLQFFSTVFSLEKYRRQFNAVAVVCIALGVGNAIQALAICRPYAFQWDKTIPGGVCGNQNLGILMVAFFNLLVDLLVFALPIAPLWGLRGVSQRKRGGLILIFCLGSFVCAITLLRIIFTFQLLNDPTNEVYWAGINAIFLQLEPALGIVAACLPTWQPLWQANGFKSVFVPTTRRDQSHGYTQDPVTPSRNAFARIKDFPSRAQSVNGLDTYSGPENGNYAESSIDYKSEKPMSSEGIMVTTEVQVEREAVEMQPIATAISTV